MKSSVSSVVATVPLLLAMAPTPSSRPLAVGMFVDSVSPQQRAGVIVQGERYAGGSSVDRYAYAVPGSGRCGVGSAGAGRCTVVGRLAGDDTG
jgi:hypothetical protein